MYLIQGFYFQRQDGFGIRTVPVDGAVAVVEDSVSWQMFSGVIERGPDRFTGGVLDALGEAELSAIEITADEVRFCKRYITGSGEIPYVLRKDGATWVGEYTVQTRAGTAKGPVRCVITEVDDALIQADLERFIAECRAERSRCRHDADYEPSSELQSSSDDIPF